MILDTHRSTSPRLAKAKLGFFTLASTGAAIIALCLGPRLVLAHNDSTDPSAVSDDNSARKAEVTIATTRPELSVKTDVKTAIRPEVSIQTDLTLTDAQGVDLAKSQESNSPDEPGADTGPKFKPNLPLPAEPRLPAPPVPARKPRPPGAVQLPGVPPVKPLGGSLEERLDRLERMVEALMAEQGPKRLRAERQMAELDQQKQMLNQQQLDELKMLAKKGDVRAAEEAKRAAKEMEKARKLERMKRDNGQWPEGFQNQIKALQKQREGLQRELEKLEHQIERLEQQQERIQEKQERHRHDHDKDSESEEPESKTGDR